MKLNNMLNMMQQCAVPGVIAIGMTVVITLGGIDLSVGGVAAFSGMVTSLLVVDGHNILLSIVVGVVLGAIMGFVTGLLISKCGLPDFIITMAMLQIARGASLLVTKGSPVFGLDEKFHVIGGGKIAGKVPIAGLIWVLLTILVFLMMKYTTYGRSLYAIGGKPRSGRALWNQSYEKLYDCICDLCCTSWIRRCFDCILSFYRTAYCL